MRAVRFEAGRVLVYDAPEPSGEGVLVQVRACGVCGSDLAMLRSGFPLAGIPGHEISGVLGDGTPVAVEPLAPCGRCEFCRRGDYQVCRQGNATVFGVGLDGGMAERLIVPPRSLVRLPQGLSPASACLVEPLAVAVHGMRRAALAGAERVGVIGAGAIGLCAVAAAVAAGCEVGLAARHEAQRAAGERLGARPLQGEYDVVADCAGTTASLADSCGWLRNRGTLLLLSTSWGDLTLPGLEVAARELDIIVSTMYGRSGAGRDVDAAAALLAGSPELAELLVTHRFPLDAAAEAFAAAEERSAGAIRVVLEP